MQCHDVGSLLDFRIILNGYRGTSTSSTTHSFEVCKSLKEIYINFWLSAGCALGQNWLRPQRWTAYSMLSIPEGKGKGKATQSNCMLWHKSAFGLTVILIFDLWPWKPFQQWPLITCAKFHWILRIKYKDVTSRVISINGQVHGQLDDDLNTWASRHLLLAVSNV